MKSKQRIWIIISLKNTYRWPINLWEAAQHHQGDANWNHCEMPPHTQEVSLHRKDVQQWGCPKGAEHLNSRNVKCCSCSGKQSPHDLRGLCPGELRTYVPTEPRPGTSTAALLRTPRSGNNSGVHRHWMEKQDVVQPCGGLVFSYKRRWNPDNCYSPQVNLGNIVQSEEARYRRANTIYRECPELPTPLRRKVD